MTLAIGKHYDDIATLRKAVKDAAILKHFEFAVVKSDSSRYTVQCSKHHSLTCKWRLHASRNADSLTFTIKTFTEEHTCTGNNHLGNRQASANWIAGQVIERLRDTPVYSPGEIVKDLRRQNGITMSYQKAWRAKEIAHQKINGSFEEGYSLLPKYCEKLKEANPGSVAFVESSEGRFLRIFVAFNASILGFTHCRPLIGIDGTHLKSKYLGTLLIATGVDGEGSCYPIAFAVVKAENDENWTWFLSNLKNIMSQNHFPLQITFLSDRQKGIVDGVTNVFPNAHHGFCMRHLVENFKRQFKNTNLISLLWKAAYATTMAKFEVEMVKINEISPPTTQWIRDTNPAYWANAMFIGHRYGHYTSNIVESFNAWILEAREQPVLQMMETIRRQLMNWFVERKKKAYEKPF